MGPIGIPELVVILLIVLLIFGPKRLPGLGRSLGGGLREFKDGISGKEKKDKKQDKKKAEASKDTAESSDASQISAAVVDPDDDEAVEPVEAEVVDSSND